MTRLVVPPAAARAFELDAGWAIRITDPEGSQVGDLFFVARPDVAERFSQSRTRVYHERLGLRVGDGLWSTRDRELLPPASDARKEHQ